MRRLYNCFQETQSEWATLMAECMGVRPLHGKGPHRLLRNGSPAASGQTTSGIANRQNCRVIATGHM
jgi:hypothetical protein